MTECLIDGCTNPVKARGWCSRHYQRWQSHGNPEAGGTTKGERSRQFLELANIETDDCVLWPYAVAGPRGYGAVQINRRRWYTHALALELRVGPRPTGMVAAHGPCNTPRCMNYRHLRWATHAENNADKLRDGTYLWGEACHTAKLTAGNVQEIRGLLAEGMKQKEIAARFGVTQSQISAIATGRTWKQVA